MAKKYETVDITHLNKGDVVFNHQNVEITVERVFRKEAKPFRVKFVGYPWQAGRPNWMVLRVTEGAP